MQTLPGTVVTAPLVVDVLDVTESRSLATLVSPTSARQARPSSETRTFPYTRLSVIVGSDRRNPTYSFEIAMCEVDVV